MSNETRDLHADQEVLIENIEDAIITALDEGIDREAIAFAIAELLSPFD
jgi:hypothetical protein